jgi:hypothetical protein
LFQGGRLGLPIRQPLDVLDSRSAARVNHVRPSVTAASTAEQAEFPPARLSAGSVVLVEEAPEHFLGIFAR